MTFRALGRIHLAGTTITIQAQDCVSIKQLDSPLRHQFHVSRMRVVGCQTHCRQQVFPNVKWTHTVILKNSGLRSMHPFASANESLHKQLSKMCHDQPLNFTWCFLSQHNQWSHCIFQRYTTSLPTSLICIASIDQRISSVETCCGASVRCGTQVWPFATSRMFKGHSTYHKQLNTIWASQTHNVHCWPLRCVYALN